jgi:cytochrome c-type biogenesis protein CcmH
MLKRLFILPVMVVALLAAARMARAQAPTPSADDVNRVARQLYCPVCQNIPLDVCPTDACAKWRDTIREKLALGWQDQQILDYFRAQYGDRVLANPTTQGFNILIWVIPPIVLAAGALFLWSFLRGVKPRPVSAEAAPPAGPADKYVEQLEKELEKRR